MAAPLAIAFAAYIFVIGHDAKHDFSTNLAADACLDSGGRYDYVAKACASR